MGIYFEVIHKDIAGRLGKLKVGGKIIKTPALLPVVNPHLQIIHPAEMKKLGIEGIITNAYIISKSDEFRHQALERGLHDLLDFDGLIMTDSGSFQMSVYGSVDITNEQTLSFQRDIGSDIWVPLDIPTHPDAPRGEVATQMDITMDRMREARTIFGPDAPISGPVQGAIFEDLRESAGRRVSGMGFAYCPIGAVVPLMEAYRYRELVNVILAAKKGLNSGSCVHLFGAGHPSMFALAVALGCDVFDSAAYALYAKEGRYITPSGTLKLDEMSELPCACQICRSHTADELRKSPDRQKLLACHNLAITMAEISRVRAAVQEGTLWELVDERCRAHPRLLDGYHRLLERVLELKHLDRATKRRFFYRGAESCDRTEVTRYHEMIPRVKLAGTALIDAGGPIPSHFPEIIEFKPPFGPVPYELSETFPVGPCEIPSWDETMVACGIKGLAALLAANTSTKVTISTTSRWEQMFQSAFPDCEVIT
ncbi:MAG: tRNA guanosine(15) transglycosylase TgtA [Methanocalculaceae archaeon]|jgi:7-cyano-7-deazaguanine tRNA-ribosyltransferase|nr:tRNA guanosine(15) transglycosylase TgtA [Methanocalculaceae archaeon]